MFLLWSIILGCSVVEGPDAEQAHASRTPISDGPLDALVLADPPSLDIGATVTLSTTGGAPGARVIYLMGPYQTNATCPALLGGHCIDLDLTQGLSLGDATVDASGITTKFLSIPDNAVSRALVDGDFSPHIQAIQIEPPAISNTARANVCDATLICGEAITCVDGFLYPTLCGDDNCDLPLDRCVEACDPSRDACCPGDEEALSEMVDACLRDDSTGHCTAYTESIGCGPIDTWNVSNVTDFSYLFAYASDFDADIRAWNTASATDMSWMFYQATAFNQDIGSWNTENVRSLNGMFNSAESFDRDIGDWNVSSAYDMSYMFTQSPFNQDIGGWDMSSVYDVSYMFWRASSFTQDIGCWDLSNVMFAYDMFLEASSSTCELSGDGSSTTPYVIDCRGDTICD